MTRADRAAVAGLAVLGALSLADHHLAVVIGCGLLAGLAVVAVAGVVTATRIIRDPGARRARRELAAIDAELDQLAATLERPCELPGDCPLGPEPHLFVPPDTPGLLCCCRQPWETPPERS